MALTERPYQYCYSKNEIRYVFDITDLERPGLLLQVKILYAAIGASSFTDLITFEALKPNADGKVYLPIQAYIDSLLEYVMPDNSAAITNAEKQCVRFYIHFREIEDASPDTEWTETESANERIAIKGGLERHKASRNNVFINYFDTAKPFLTWQPSGRFIFYDEPAFLTFLNRTGAGFTMNVLIKATDSTEYNFTVDFSANTGLLYHIPVSPVALDFASQTTKEIWYYEISIVDAEDVVLANAYRLYIEHRPAYEYYDLVYHGSLGGIDAVRVTGDTPVSYDRTTVEADGGISVNDWNAATRSHEQSSSSILLKKSFKGNIGLLKTRTREQIESFIDLLASKSIYMLVDERWVPVLNMQRSADIGSRKKITDGFALEWQLSENNEVFTPSSKSFGLGTL